MSTQELLKKKAAEAALSYIHSGDVVGVGSGSTVRFFIEALGKVRHRIDGAVSTSQLTTQWLRQQQIEVLDLNGLNELPLYVDGADEFNTHRYLIKGGGGALTQEKIVRSCAKQFVCMVDQSKQVDVLGHFPLPIEVIPMGRSAVARALLKLNGNPVYRQGFITDNGNVILDCYNLDLTDPISMEQRINNIPGVVTNGLFALQRADIILMAHDNGVQVLEN